MCEKKPSVMLHSSQKQQEKETISIKCRFLVLPDKSRKRTEETVLLDSVKSRPLARCTQQGRSNTSATTFRWQDIPFSVSEHELLRTPKHLVATGLSED